MEKFTLEYGIGGLCVLFTLSILARVGEFLWQVKEKREALSESSVKSLTLAVERSTVAMQHLSQRIEHVEASIADLPKLKMDLRRFYTALKSLSGPKWTEIRDEIMKDDFSL